MRLIDRFYKFEGCSYKLEGRNAVHLHSGVAKLPVPSSQRGKESNALMYTTARADGEIETLGEVVVHDACCEWVNRNIEGVMWSCRKHSHRIVLK